MQDTSVCGTARKMVELYGSEAQLEARRRCERAIEREDMRSFERWAVIAGLIGGLRGRSAAPPSHLNRV